MNEVVKINSYSLKEVKLPSLKFSFDLNKLKSLVNIHFHSSTNGLNSLIVPYE